jgi:hypothetical protein
MFWIIAIEHSNFHSEGWRRCDYVIIGPQQNAIVYKCNLDIPTHFSAYTFTVDKETGNHETGTCCFKGCHEIRRNKGIYQEDNQNRDKIPEGCLSKYI